MSPEARAKYFGEFWPAACKVKGWKRSDEARRRAVTLECMAAVRGPEAGTSDPAFGDDELTALFCYLDFLAHPADLDRAARWVDCQTDYHAFNRARQADWHEEKLFGGRKNRLVRDRFGGKKSAAGEPLEPFDPEAIRKRHLTMASRHQKREREQLSSPPAGAVRAAPAVVLSPPGELPF